MVEDCVIERASTATVYDEELMDYVPVDPAKVYGGTGNHDADKCRIHTYQPQESTPDAGQHVFTIQRYFVSIPVGAGPVDVNDVVRITASPMDAHNVGRRFRIASTFNKTFATAQRLMADEITG